MTSLKKEKQCSLCNYTLAHSDGAVAGICNNTCCNVKDGGLRDPRRCPYCGDVNFVGTYQSWGVTSFVCLDCGADFCAPSVGAQLKPPAGYSGVIIAAP